MADFKQCKRFQRQIWVIMPWSTIFFFFCPLHMMGTIANLLFYNTQWKPRNVQTFAVFLRVARTRRIPLKRVIQERAVRHELLFISQVSQVVWIITQEQIPFSTSEHWRTSICYKGQALPAHESLIFSWNSQRQTASFEIMCGRV